MLNRIQLALDLASKVAITLAALILVYAVSHILLETVLRSIFSTSTHVLDEFVGFAILSITFLSLAWTFRSGGMIRVTLLTDQLPLRAARYANATVSGVAGLLAMGLCVFFYRNFMKDLDRGAVSESVAEVPLWIPGLIVLAGASLLAAQLLLHAVRALLAESEPPSDAPRNG